MTVPEAAKACNGLINVVIVKLTLLVDAVYAQNYHYHVLSCEHVIVKNMREFFICFLIPWYNMDELIASMMFTILESFYDFGPSLV